ncbi:unnamed protein product [Soboliphyme baturini]|uniref:Mitotic checkpoint serine/threonine-protein kinase BUB1 n=1 Tax=Soboliphyme baturini TaxID=241478 RepID=A0A183IIY5_9BILA|nr:unnamed protein product [Soboliphyme baturini]
MSEFDSDQRTETSERQLYNELSKARKNNGDTLAVWIRLIHWTEEHQSTAPPGHMRFILERCIEDVRRRKEYFQDERFLEVFQKYTSFTKHLGPAEIYERLAGQHIFTDLSKFYIAWALELEARRDNFEAMRVFRLGYEAHAQPSEHLERAYADFMARNSVDDEERTCHILTTLHPQPQEMYAKRHNLEKFPERFAHRHSLTDDVFKKQWFVDLVPQHGNGFDEAPSRAASSATNSFTAVNVQKALAAYGDTLQFSTWSTCDESSIVPRNISEPSTANEMLSTASAAVHQKSGSAAADSKSTTAFKVFDEFSDSKGDELTSNCVPETSDAIARYQHDESQKSEKPLINTESASTAVEADFVKTAVVTHKKQLMSTMNSHRVAATIARLDSEVVVTSSQDAVAAFSTSDLEPLPTVRMKTPVTLLDASPCASGTDMAPLRMKFDEDDAGVEEQLRKSPLFLESLNSVKDEMRDLDLTTSGDLEHINSAINPWDPELVLKLYGEVRELQRDNDHLFESSSLLPCMQINRCVTLCGKTYICEKLLAEGRLENIYMSTVRGTYEKVVLKVKRSPCPWEHYISETILHRIKTKNLSLVENGFAWIKEAYVFSDGFVLALEFFKHHTLTNLVNRYRNAGQSMKEPMVAFLTLEMMKLLNALRSVDIIHAGIKPDSFVLVHPHSTFLQQKDAEYVDFMSLPVSCLRLMDFSRSIDMSLLPTGSTFAGRTHTSSFVCCEMLDGRPWTYQIDYFGLLCTICFLIEKKYMTTFKYEKRWKCTTSIPKTWNLTIWHRLFDSLLNIQSCDELPDLNIFIEELSKYLSKLITYEYSTWESELLKMYEILR